MSFSNAHTSSGLEFLNDNGARRAGGYGDQPNFYGPARAEDEETSNPEDDILGRRCDWNYEFKSGFWERVVVRNVDPFDAADPLMPRRFVDGKDVGRVIAYISSPEGFPVPVRLSQIGAVGIRGVSPEGACPQSPISLRVENRRVEKVVSLMADLFPWDEIERFAAGLQSCGLRLLIARRMGPEDDPRNVAWLQENVRYRTREEMFRLERHAASAIGDHEHSIPVTIADGRLDDKEEIVRGDAPLIGLVKTHANTSYLHDEGWSVLYGLRPGERTPVLALTTEKLKLVTWYLRLIDGDGGPFDGLIRIEMSRNFFENVARGNFSYINQLSHALCRWRTRDSGYGRAGVTLHPIQQAEELLRAHFIPTDTLISRFYHLSGL